VSCAYEFDVFVFDFDGTLVDSNEIKEKAFFDVVFNLKKGSEIMHTTLKKTKGDRTQIFKSFITNYEAQIENTKLNINQLIKKYSYITDSKVQDSKNIDGAEDLLKLLRRKQKKVFINSLTPQQNLIKILDEKKWISYFDGIYGSPKSKFDNLKIIEKEENISPSKFLIIGDGVDDKESAEKFGGSFYGVGKIFGHGINNSLLNLYSQLCDV
tara:strand:- start:628 stop:1263 length:636 start_codon:yes stop_codon:yes gene_type:complete